LYLDDSLPVAFNITTVAVANGQYQGGGIRIVPEADIEDGLAEITSVERVSLAEVLANLRSSIRAGSTHTPRSATGARRACARRHPHGLDSWWEGDFSGVVDPVRQAPGFGCRVAKWH